MTHVPDCPTQYSHVVLGLISYNILRLRSIFCFKLQAIIVSCCGCFHGRTLAVISMSCDNEATRGFGPLLPGHLKVDFGDEVALEKLFKGRKYLYSLDV